MKLYTKSGDCGKTSLIGGTRATKNDCRVEAYGSVDELSSFTALLADMLAERHPDKCELLVDELRRITSVLMSVEALLAVGEDCKKEISPISKETIDWLEGRIDALQEECPPLTSFTIPGGCMLTSLCHVCRTVCRRAERAAVCAMQNYDIDQSALVWLNRLSDYFYAMGRVLTQRLGIEEMLWRP